MNRYLVLGHSPYSIHECEAVSAGQVGEELQVRVTPDLKMGAKRYPQVILTPKLQLPWPLRYRYQLNSERHVWPLPVHISVIHPEQRIGVIGLGEFCESLAQAKELVVSYAAVKNKP